MIEMGSGASVKISPTTYHKESAHMCNIQVAWRRNKKIEKMLHAAKLEASKTVKLLLLGAGESGKSTIAKQLRLIHLEGFNEDERHVFSHIIRSNVTESILSLLGAINKLDIKHNDPKFENDAAYFYSYMEMIGTRDHEFTPELTQVMDRIWNYHGIQECYRRRNEFQLLDNASYFFGRLSAISSDNYIPCDDDIIRARLKSTGIIATEFKFRKRKFVVVDIGGQRTERRKWIHCFDDVTAIMYTVAISAFDQKLREDPKKNRMMESMEIFNAVCNSMWFRKTPLMIFFNKMDLFKEKIKTIPLSVFCPEYTGSNSSREARNYICDKFLALNKFRHRQIYHHFTVATDTGNIQFVFDSCADVILKSSLESIGMF
ncbi:guanine nucleotide-binding protein G(i) subunit alpha-like isoform X1 [Lytechinus pictus]|uniref:guanine nucleotide-binding protein G(i) subunit alpha-like isoform X1 n=1 Tax=Lytechinus pictus TaxID=7653 RepID=UPI0030BA0B46